MKATRNKREKPIEIKRGSVLVKIYWVEFRSDYKAFQIADYSDGLRKLRSFSDEAEARKEAALIAQTTPRLLKGLETIVDSGGGEKQANATILPVTSARSEDAPELAHSSQDSS